MKRNKNSTNTPLGANQTFTGEWEFCGDTESVKVAVLSDTDANFYFDFSDDGVTTVTTEVNSVDANKSENHIFQVTREYYRIRFVNGSTPQTTLNIRASFSINEILTIPANEIVQRDFDAQVIRLNTSPIEIVKGRIEGSSVILKFGRNPDVDTASVPEDIWNGGGTYAGFPTGAPEEFEAFSSSASDTGVLTITYLPTINSTEYVTASVTLNETTPVPFGVTGYRMHTARYASGSATGFNVGTITVRHRTTTANIFCVMPIGRSQTNVAAYTVPAGCTAIITRLFCRVIGSTTGQVDGALWVRENGGSPRLRRPFTAATADAFEEIPFGGILINEKCDITVRISSASANNLDIIAGFDLLCMV